jgi:large subunit ribosomal protein L32
MAVPRNRSSNARKNSRSAHSALKPKSLSDCSNCGNRKMPHRLCPSCGYYAKREIVSQKAQEEKK